MQQFPDFFVSRFLCFIPVLKIEILTFNFKNKNKEN